MASFDDKKLLLAYGFLRVSAVLSMQSCNHPISNTPIAFFEDYFPIYHEVDKCQLCNPIIESAIIGIHIVYHFPTSSREILAASHAANQTSTCADIYVACGKQPTAQNCDQPNVNGDSNK